MQMNIVFDLGGVVVAWKPDEILASGFDDPATRELVGRELFGHPDWLALDRGDLAWSDAIARGSIRTGISESKLSAFLDSIPPQLVANPDTVDLIYRLKGLGHKLYCLSNMPKESIEHLERIHSFWDAFSGKVISSRVNLCKPEPAIYSHLLETYDLVAANTIFIDDNEPNLVAARELGIRTIKFETIEQCERDLVLLGCL